MRKVQINKIGVSSLGKVVGFVQAVVALVYGLIVSLSATAGVLGDKQ